MAAQWRWVEPSDNLKQFACRSHASLSNPQNRIKANVYDRFWNQPGENTGMDEVKTWSDLANMCKGIQLCTKGGNHAGKTCRQRNRPGHGEDFPESKFICHRKSVAWSSWK
jgi:hypothetical protein